MLVLVHKAGTTPSLMLCFCLLATLKRVSEFSGVHAQARQGLACMQSCMHTPTQTHLHIHPHPLTYICVTHPPPPPHPHPHPHPHTPTHTHTPTPHTCWTTLKVSPLGASVVITISRHQPDTSLMFSCVCMCTSMCVCVCVVCVCARVCWCAHLCFCVYMCRQASPAFLSTAKRV